MAKKRGGRIFNKEEITEDWCFECKDGGELMICDYGRCLKAYHPACVGKDDSVLTSDEHWICGRHTCLICKGSSYYHCYCCKRAACSRCIGLIDFVHLKGTNGLCNNCLKLALLVEEDRNIDSDGESVDLRDCETYEGLFREYYEIVKEKEGIDKNRLLAGKAQLDKEKICQISSYSDKRCEKEDDQFSSDNEDFNDGEPQKKKLKMKRCTQQKTKMQRKVNCSLEQNKISSIWFSTAAQSQFAALIPENIKLVYLKRSLVLEMIKQPESIETKIIGSFVRVKLDPSDSKQRNSHQLVQITGVFSGIKHESCDKCHSESLIQVSNMARDVCLTTLSDDEISEEECDELRKKVKAGVLKKLTIVELELRAKILHEDITKHRIAQELKLLKIRIDVANEKGWRYEFYKHMERKKLLQKASYLSAELQNIPGVIPEEVELESLDRNDNQMHQCSDQTTPTMQNIPGATPEKVELEPLSKDEKEVNQMHQCLDETTPKMRNIPGVIPNEVELEPLAEDECYGNKMRQCADKTTLTKKNILGVIPEEVELDPMAEDERDGNKMHQRADEKTLTKKNILVVIPEEVELERLDKDKKDVNQMHQCLDETAPTKKNILGVIPEKVELESLAENEDEKLSSDHGDFSDGGPQKKRDEKKRCRQQKRKMQRRVTSKKKEFVGWGSKSLIDFLRFIGQDTREKLSPYDVASMVSKYVKEQNLIHPVIKRRILCDVQLEAIFGKKVVNKDRIFSLLESHFVENEMRLQKDELDHDLEDDDTEMMVASKTEEKVEQNKRSSIWYSTAAQSQFAALIPENIKLVYLKRSLVLEMIKKSESIETKIIGSFVRVKLDPCDFEQHNAHQLVQITGIKHGSSDKYNSESLIQVSNMAGDVCLTMLSDDEFTKEECDDLRKKVKAGVLKKLTIVELELRAKILHEDITKHRIAQELKLLKIRIDVANEEGWRYEFYKHMERKKLLQKPSYLSAELQNIPGVIPEELELESLDRNDNQMHQCSDETTPTKQNIPGATPEKVELEPLSKDEKEVNQMHQCLGETTPTMRNIPGVIPQEVELEPLAEDEWYGNEMHQCADKTTLTKKNILGVIPEEVELDPMVEDERDGNKMHQRADEKTLTKKNILVVIPEEVELERLDKDKKDVNQMHQCLDETAPTKKNILGVIPEKVELESLAENEDENLSSDHGDFSDGGPQKKRDEKKRCTQQKTKMQRRVTSKKKEFVGWGSKSLIDFLRFIGQDTREKLSPYDVASMVSKYVKEQNLIHPVEKRRILCDVQLEAIFGKKVVNKDRIFSLLESHFVENEMRLQKDELDHDLEDDDTEMMVVSKTEEKVEQNKRSSIWYSTAAQSQFAALIPENIKLVYLKRSLVLEMIKKPESIETKIIGSFVRVKLDPCDFEQHNAHQLVQITGIKHGSSDKCNSESLIQVSNMAGDVCLTMLSDDEFTKEECDDFRKKVKAGVLKKLTIVELEQKAKILHEDITKHRIARELEFALQNIPRVIPEEVELESLDRNDNQMHQCTDETTLHRKIILE